MPTNTFAGAGLDRMAARRTDPAWLERALADPAARALVTVGGEIVVAGEVRPLPADDWDVDDLQGGGPRPLVVGAAEVEPLPGTAPVLLGVRDGVPLFGIEAASAPQAGRAASLRDLAPVLGQADGGLVAFAVAMGNWHRRHRFCANCGAPSEPAEAGFVRVCPACGAQHHPRTDPVVIMLVEDGDRALLGRQAAWPPGRYSALAGFVEPGESLEEAVVREVFEESGVEVAGVTYHSSQPWPFPASLMLGFTCRYAGGEPVTRDGELQDIRWFARDELRAGSPALPPRLAIARTLIDHWVDGGTR